MNVLIGGSISGFGNVIYDYNAFIRIAREIENTINLSEKDTLIFAGSPCSDCLSLQIAKDKGCNIEYHLPCESNEENPGEKIMKEYNKIEPEFREYLLSLFREGLITAKEKGKLFVYNGHKERNDAIAKKCDVFFAVTTMSNEMFLNPPENIKKNSGTIYVWDKCEGKDRYHYSLLSNKFLNK